MYVPLPALEKESDSILLMDGGVLYGSRILDRLVRSANSSALPIDREYSAPEGVHPLNRD